jgi:hypothetical protein
MLRSAERPGVMPRPTLPTLPAQVAWRIVGAIGANLMFALSAVTIAETWATPALTGRDAAGVAGPRADGPVALPEEAVSSDSGSRSTGS